MKAARRVRILLDTNAYVAHRGGHDGVARRFRSATVVYGSLTFDRHFAHVPGLVYSHPDD